MSHEPTISIIVAAYNEAGNIEYLLNSLLSQREDGFRVGEIKIVSDGSTDETAACARRVVDSRITVVESPTRNGKSHYLNEFFRSASGDIIAFFDADVILESELTLGNLVRPLLKDTKIGLVGGNAQSQPGVTFMENAINVTCRAFDKIRIHFRGGNNAFGANGCIMALSREFAHSVVIPEDMIANDQFLYFSCITKGYAFRHQRSAIAWYRSPSTLKDHLRQNSRFMAAHDVMGKLFGSITDREYAVPKSMVLRFLLPEVLKMPVHGLAILFINRYCRYMATRDAARFDSKWDMAMSTKEGIGNV